MQTIESRIDDALTAIGSEVGTDAATRALVGELVLATKEWLQIFSKRPAAELKVPVDALLEAILPTHPLDDVLGDRPQWGDPSSMRAARWYWSERFRTLRDYAEQGQIWPGKYDDETEDHVAKLPKLLKEVEGFLLHIPTEWFRDEELAGTYHTLWIVLGKARARYRLDNHEDLQFYEVVLLSGMAPKSVRNATQERHGAGRLILGGQDAVTNTDAASWLRDRRTFTPTPGSEIDTERTATTDSQEFVFIPVDESGRPFDPELAVQGPPGPSYEYAVNGEPCYREKYMEALADLQTADQCQWRYTDGTWAKQASWTRISKSVLRRKEKTASDKRRVLCADWQIEADRRFEEIMKLEDDA